MKSDLISEFRRYTAMRPSQEFRLRLIGAECGYIEIDGDQTACGHPNLKVGVFVTLCTPDVINLITVII
jgi:hypothetical protein